MELLIVPRIFYTGKVSVMCNVYTGNTPMIDLTRCILRPGLRRDIPLFVYLSSEEGFPTWY